MRRRRVVADPELQQQETMHRHRDRPLTATSEINLHSGQFIFSYFMPATCTLHPPQRGGLPLHPSPTHLLPLFYSTSPLPPSPSRLALARRPPALSLSLSLTATPSPPPPARRCRAPLSPTPSTSFAPPPHPPPPPTPSPPTPQKWGLERDVAHPHAPSCLTPRHINFLWMRSNLEAPLVHGC